MNPKIKKAWREKLATEKQTTDGVLCNAEDDSYCCWGLYYEVLVEMGLAVRNTQPINGMVTYRLKDENEYGVWAYPTNAAMELGEIPEYVNGSDATVYLLAGMNDEGSNFAAISNVIEELL